MKKCNVSACAFCESYKNCEKRKLVKCKCGNESIGVLFNVLPKKVIRKKSIGVYAICPKCEERTRTYSYEYQAINAWNEMMRRAK